MQFFAIAGEVTVFEKFLHTEVAEWAESCISTHPLPTLLEHALVSEGGGLVAVSRQLSRGKKTRTHQR